MYLDKQELTFKYFSVSYTNVVESKRDIQYKDLEICKSVLIVYYKFFISSHFYIH